MTGCHSLGSELEEAPSRLFFFGVHLPAVGRNKEATFLFEKGGG